jgi:hypothetical protein
MNPRTPERHYFTAAQAHGTPFAAKAPPTTVPSRGTSP